MQKLPDMDKAVCRSVVTGQSIVSPSITVSGLSMPGPSLLYEHMYVCMHVYMHVCMHVSMHVCMHVCVHVYWYAYDR